jgi:ATP-binding cassette, subfamily B, bacterial
MRVPRQRIYFILKIKIRTFQDSGLPRPAGAILRHLVKVAQPCRTHLLCIFLLALASVPLALLFPLQIAIDSVIGQHPLPDWLSAILPASVASTRNGRLGIAAAMLILTTLLSNLQTVGAWILQTFTGEKLVLDFRNLLFWHVQQLKLATHDQRGTNELSYTIQYDAPAIQYIFLQGLLPIVTAALTFAAFMVVTARLDWPIAAIALAISPLLVMIARRSGRQVRQGYEGVKQLDASAMLVLSEALTFVRTVKAAGREGFEGERFAVRSHERMQAQLRLAWVQALYHVLIVTAIGFAGIATLLVGVRHVLAGAITTGQLLLIMTYVTQLYEPLKTISGKLPDMQSWLVSARRGLAVLEEAPEVANLPGSARVHRVHGGFRLRDLSFEYRSGQPVLKDVTVDIPAGSRVGILGPSGSGKSTLVNLLTRFYDPTAGSILLDGLELRRYNLTDLRRQYALLPQEPVVFSTTIAGNIAYARPEASRAEVIAAAQAARADEFISALPQGYDTPIGQGNIRLSGGQRQRIGLARAFLKNAPVLILDEPTSALDVQTEENIMAATRELMKGRTCFIVAHRLNTLRDCDLLLVLEDGRLKTSTGDFRQAVSAAGAEIGWTGRSATAEGPVLA